jgi:hypothetical protein
LFLPAFLRALEALSREMARGAPAYLTVGVVVGGLAGLAVAEAIGISAERLPSIAAPSPEGEKAMPPSRNET